MDKITRDLFRVFHSLEKRDQHRHVPGESFFSHPIYISKGQAFSVAVYLQVHRVCTRDNASKNNTITSQMSPARTLARSDNCIWAMKKNTYKKKIKNKKWPTYEKILDTVVSLSSSFGLHCDF